MSETIRKLTADEVTFSIEAEDEDLAIEGSFSSGDDAKDAELVASIKEDLEGGNPWAWCSVKVTASWKDWEGTAYLGGCSYKSEEDFKVEGGYYAQMKEEALDELNATVARNAEALLELVES